MGNQARVRLPTHPIVRQLWQMIELKRVSGAATPEVLLELFWDEIKSLGTPLLHDVDGTTRATFLYREEIDHMINRDLAFHRVAVAWSGSYTAGHNGSRLPLMLMPRSNVWWAEVDLPENFTGVYCYQMDDSEGLITEDVHEPWAMSFSDEYNQRRTQDADSSYSRFVVTTKSGGGYVQEGTTSVLEAPAAHLPLPTDTRHSRGQSQTRPRPEAYPVWTYTPHPSQLQPDGHPPLVVLMAGQFHESMNLHSTMDRAIDSGAVPPVRLWTPGYHRHGFKAWGWRHGNGPGDISVFFKESLLPLTGNSPVHLFGWAYTCYSTIETGIRIASTVKSIILIDPVPAIASQDPSETEWDVERAFEDLAKEAPTMVIAIGNEPDRGQSRFAWHSSDSERFAKAARDAGLDVRRFEVTDPNMVAQGEAIPAGIASALGEGRQCQTKAADRS